jgi:hypothetical protein
MRSLGLHSQIQMSRIGVSKRVVFCVVNVAYILNSVIKSYIYEISWNISLSHTQKARPQGGLFAYGWETS